MSPKPPPPIRRALLDTARPIMEANWREPHGFTSPNITTYPWLWLWDSCFHSIIWASLGDHDRARRELTTLLGTDTKRAFVPHMRYLGDRRRGHSLWGIPGASTLTQPPLYGHALAVLSGAGVDVGDLAPMVTRALWHLFDARRAPCGLLQIFHPWESGTDDSPRWGPWQPAPFRVSGWRKTKNELVTSLEISDDEAVGNRSFSVCSAGWNALVAWNAQEAGRATGDAELLKAGVELASALDRICWDSRANTWVDVAPDSSLTSAARTADALLGVLVTDREDRARAVLETLLDPDQFGAPYGPTGVHRDEPGFDPRTYWRGVAWPPLGYLWRTAADRRGHSDYGDAFDQSLTRGVVASAFSEYWDPTTGVGLGAHPQSWACLAAVPRQLALLR